MYKIKKALCLGLSSLSFTNFVYSSEKAIIDKYKINSSLEFKMPKYVSDFNIIEKIGQGGCGSVFLADFRDKNDKEHTVVLKGVSKAEAEVAAKLIKKYDKLKQYPFLMHVYRIYTEQDEKKSKKYNDYQNSLPWRTDSKWIEFLNSVNISIPSNPLDFPVWREFNSKYVISYEYIDGLVYDTPVCQQINNLDRNSWFAYFYKGGKSVKFNDLLEWSKGIFSSLKFFRTVVGYDLGEIKERNIMMRKLNDNEWQPVLIDFGAKGNIEDRRGAAAVLRQTLRYFLKNNDKDDKFKYFDNILSSVENGKAGYVEYDDILDKLNELTTK